MYMKIKIKILRLMLMGQLNDMVITTISQRGSLDTDMPLIREYKLHLYYPVSVNSCWAAATAG